MTRLFALAALALAALPASAQTNGPVSCTNGTATLGTRTYTCNGVDVMSIVPTCTARNCTTGPLRAQNMNDIWGWTDPTTGREYALGGTINGTVFVDVTNPSAPAVLGRMVTQTSASDWRDIKVYNDYAFVVSEAPGHGMQVFSLARLRGLTANAARNFTPDAVYSGFGKAHNIVIDEASGYAYGVGANQSGYLCNAGGLHMVDIRNPLDPAYAGCFDQDGYTHDAQCIVYDGPDTDYTGRQICFNSNEDTVTIVDVTDKAAPRQISRTFYPNPVYTHQGWLTENRRRFMVDDEVDSSANGTRTIVMDVTDLDNVSFGYFFVAANAVRDHNQYVRGRYSFQSNYEGGLRILDIGNVENGTITEKAFFDSYPQGNGEGYNGNWSNYPYFASGTVVISDINNGLFVLRPTTLAPVAGEAGDVAGEAFALSAPSPNPATSEARLRLVVAEAQSVRAVLLDALGREVAVVFEGTAHGTTDLVVPRGALPAGTYVLRASGPAGTASQHLTFTR